MTIWNDVLDIVVFKCTTITKNQSSNFTALINLKHIIMVWKYNLYNPNKNLNISNSNVE